MFVRAVADAYAVSVSLQIDDIRRLLDLQRRLDALGGDGIRTLLKRPNIVVPSKYF